MSHFHCDFQVLYSAYLCVGVGSLVQSNSEKVVGIEKNLVGITVTYRMSEEDSRMSTPDTHVGSYNITGECGSDEF